MAEPHAGCHTQWKEQCQERSAATKPEASKWGLSHGSAPALARTCACSAPSLCRDVQALLFPMEIRNATEKGKSLQAPELHQRMFFQAQKLPPALPADLGPPGQHLMLEC